MKLRPIFWIRSGIASLFSVGKRDWSKFIFGDQIHLDIEVDQTKKFKVKPTERTIDPNERWLHEESATDDSAEFVLHESEFESTMDEKEDTISILHDDSDIDLRMRAEESCERAKSRQTKTSEGKRGRNHRQRDELSETIHSLVEKMDNDELRSLLKRIEN